MSRVTVTVEGGLLPDDLLERIADGSAPGQRAADFGLASGRLSDEIMRAFSDAQSYWTAFKHRHERASKSGRESVTTITRESFVIPLLEALAYKLEFKRSLTAGDQSFVISHTSGDEPTAPPANIIGADDKLDERGSSRRSAHSSVQEYLNVSDCLWGIATNGHKLRLLRDSSRLSKPRYIEFDLEGMMESNVFSDFHLLYRLLHQSRLPHSSADASECWLEKYYQDGIDQGSRVSDRLRDGVIEALKLFGNAFLAHPQSEHLRNRIVAGEISAPAYYRELLRLVYRLLFLMVAEERRLMFPDSRENEQRRAIFAEHYGINRLRGRAERYIGDDPEIDLWESLKQTFFVLSNDRPAHMFGMAALNGELFGPHGCPHLDGGGAPEQSAYCRNDQLLHAIHSLSTFDDDGVRRRVNFAALDVEELGSVYESLLEYDPQLSLSPPSFDLAWGGERKSTGSYYTPPDLVRELIDNALVPVMEERLKPAKGKQERENAILSMRVIDPAAGSGHFLLAAARRLGRELAKVRTEEEEPPPSAFRRAVRDVIRECIYAVDKNPLAVDLCKMAFWTEGHNAGQPLSFLDHHVKCGNTLVGVSDLKVLDEGIPDDAYKPISGEDKDAAREYRKRNKSERESRQMTLSPSAPPLDLVAGFDALAHLDEQTPADVERKEAAYLKLREGREWIRRKNACDAWTAAFFTPLKFPEQSGQDTVPTTATVAALRAGQQIYGKLLQEITKAALTHSFFHWPLEFPAVFANGGFDVVLGNPPFINIIDGKIPPRVKHFIASHDQRLTGTADIAYHFLSRADEETRSRGRVGFIQPRSLLNAESALPLRRNLLRRRPPVFLHVPRTASFFKGVSAYVCLIVLGVAQDCLVSDADTLMKAPLKSGSITQENWWAAFQTALAGETISPPGDDADAIPLSQVFDVVGSMTTAEAYMVKNFLTDEESEMGPKLVTTGLIDPFTCKWGQHRCRYLGKNYSRPRIVADTNLPPLLAKRLRSAKRPKLLVAGLSNRLEAYFDQAGDCCGAVSTFSIFHPTNSIEALADLCGWLNSDEASRLVRAQLGAASVGGGYMTIKKKTILQLPIPKSFADTQRTKAESHAV